MKTFLQKTGQLTLFILVLVVISQSMASGEKKESGSTIQEQTVVQEKIIEAEESMIEVKEDNSCEAISEKPDIMEELTYSGERKVKMDSIQPGALFLQ